MLFLLDLWQFFLDGEIDSNLIIGLLDWIHVFEPAILLLKSVHNLVWEECLEDSHELSFIWDFNSQLY